MRLTNQQTSSRRRRIAAAARAAEGKPTVKAEYAPTPVVVESSAPNVEHERRSLNRVAMNGEVIVRRIGGFNFEVALRDMTAHGCQVELVEACEVGDAIITRFPQLEPLGSSVRWTRGTTTGIEFQTKIHPAVFDHLLGRLNVAEAA